MPFIGDLPMKKKAIQIKWHNNTTTKHTDMNNRKINLLMAAMLILSVIGMILSIAMAAKECKMKKGDAGCRVPNAQVQKTVSLTTF